jgi:signal transduction histidine kinase
MSLFTAPAMQTNDLGVEDLKLLMQSVDDATQRLHDTHVALQRQVGQLQSELAEANAQLRRSRSLAALGEMAAGIAHEIRNPLGSIRLYVQMLAEDLADAPAPRAICDKITTAVTGMEAIVRDVLMFSRDASPRPTATSAAALFEAALSSCDALLRQSGVEVVPAAEADRPLKADVTLMTQALGNLVRNAVEAMQQHEGRRRRITLESGRAPVRCPDGRRASRVVLSVTDTGPGISPEAQRRMFNPFFTTRPTGTGLGLAIVHRIVDAHGGHIKVDSRPDAGTRIDLCLPEAPATGSPSGRADS